MTGTQPLRALLAEATPGPWFAMGTSVSKPEVDIVDWAYHDLPPSEWPESVTEAEATARLIALAPDMARLLLDMGDALTATAQVGCQPGTRFQDYTETCGICDTCVARDLLARLSALGDGTADR